MVTTNFLHRCGMVFAASLALNGCANNVLTAAEAERYSALELCVGVLQYGPISAKVASEEIARRGVNCEAMKEAVAARIGRSQTTVVAPQPAPPRQTVCTRIGSSMVCQ